MIEAYLGGRLQLRPARRARRAGGVSEPLLEVRDLVYYGGIQALPGRLARGGRGRGRDAHRRQRRRQDHHAAGGLGGLSAPRRGSRRPSRATTSRRSRPTSSWRAASPTRPRGAASSLNLTVRENLDLGAYLRTRPGRHRRPTASAPSRSSPSCASGATRSPARSPAASSRCWRSAGR